jgi:iron-sulfur cluster repair protein YtfE (RIC family)
MMLSTFPIPYACIYKVRAKRVLHSGHSTGGIWIAQVAEATNMEAKDTTIRKTPCSSPLPELEVPMINTMVACLGVEHRKLSGLNMQLAYGATRLASDPDSIEANQKVLRVWDEIRQDLWSHLQIEDELVFSWGKAHQAIPGTLIDTLKNERQQMRKLMTALRALSPRDREPQTAGDRSTFAQTLLALARTLDSHVESYDGGVLPSILRALFHK